jgi:phage recombination protein Bet
MSEQTVVSTVVPGTELTRVSRLFPGWASEEVDLARRTVAPDATEHELALFLRLCKTYGLDPFRKELILEKRRRRRADGKGYDIVPVFITTRDGYLKVAQRDPHYGGLQSGVVRDGDEFEFDVEACRIKHRFGASRGKIAGAWAVAKHAQRPPFMAYVEFGEYYNPESDTWKKHPAAMIQKVAEVFVLRRQFGITGIVTREEMSRDLAHETGTLPAQPLRAELSSSGEDVIEVPADGGEAATVSAKQDSEDPGKPIVVPSATDFWRAVRAAAARSGEEAQAYVRSRSGGETDLRRLAPEVAWQLYQEGLAEVQGTDGPATPPASTTGRRPAAKLSAKFRRNYTEFWGLVNEAARLEGDVVGGAWLARLAGGASDPRQLDDATFIGLLTVARRIVAGKAHTKDLGPEPSTPSEANAGVETPGGGAAVHAAQAIQREQIKEIQRIWRERRVHPNTQCEQVRRITGNHMILARMTEAQADQLLSALRSEEVAAS